MYKRYSIAEAKNQLPAVIHAVEQGEPIEITRHGRAVAIVISISDYLQICSARPDLWAAYQSWCERRSELTDADVDALADPSRDIEPSGRIDW
jgi:prevent-host-death family protein